jgi:hypothetical protein
MRTTSPVSLFLLIPIVSLILINGCKKDEQPTQNEQSTKSELLCHEWRIAHTYVEDQSNLIEVNLGFEMTLKFTADKQAVFSVNNQTETSVWSWANSEKTITFQTPSGQINWDVQKLTDQEFWYRFLSGSGNYVVYKCEKIN